MAGSEDAPELDQPKHRPGLKDVFADIDRWGQDAPEALQAILDALPRSFPDSPSHHTADTVVERHS